MTTEIGIASAVAALARGLDHAAHAGGIMRRLVTGLTAQAQPIEHSLVLALRTECQVGPTRGRAQHVRAKADRSQRDVVEIRLRLIGLDHFDMVQARNREHRGPAHLAAQVLEHGRGDLHQPIRIVELRALLQ